MIAFGPVPSRRFGRSLGINNIPPKVCSYACVYCQLGRTTRLQRSRQHMYGADAVVHAVAARVQEAAEQGVPIDTLTFVPDGEPTLDLDLGEAISRLKPLGIPIAVISNASLLWDEQVQDALAEADSVSLKIDASTESAWHRINRPHGRLKLDEVLRGIRGFNSRYRGRLVTETMLVEGINTAEAELDALEDFLMEIFPSTVYLAIPIRPPAEAWVKPPDETTINQWYQRLSGGLARVELLLGPEVGAFSSIGDVAQDLMGITAVHPMRESAVRTLLAARGVGWEIVERLLEQDILATVSYGSDRFFLYRYRRGFEGTKD